MTVSNRVVRAGGLAALLFLVGGAVRGADESDPIPAPFAPFEYLIGSWKGQARPAANPVRGWGETHAWAWRFAKGKPVGLSVTMTGDKVLTQANLSYNEAAQEYRLEGTDPDKKTVAFSGTFDKAGKRLTLDRVGTTTDGARQQVTLFPNSNLIRYSVTVAQKEPGAPQYKKTIEVGLTKEGEAFAAGSSAADLPKCVVTGGAATMNVTFEGKTYPLCCSGCKAEFGDNPAKYVKKASMRAEAGSSKSSAKPTPSVGKDDGSFAGLADEPKAKAKVKAADKPKAKAPEKAETAKPDTKDTAAKKPARGKTAVDPVEKAASLLKLGQSLEKAGKLTGALGYYRQVVKDYPATPSAKTAAERVKALSTPDGSDN